MQRTPSEVCGVPYSLVSRHLEQIKKEYPCPFLGTMCVKTSTHRDIGHIPFGVCSVWYKPEFLKEAEPHIICPKRLGTMEVIREAVSVLGLRNGLQLLQSVRIPPLGTMDYVAALYDKKDNKVLDFAGIEVMAVSTTNTGKIIRAYLDVLAGRPGTEYKYGINYRQVLSRMLVQLCSKGAAFATWGKKTLWIVQDVLYDYMESTYDLRLAKGAKEPDPILMMVYSLVQDKDRFSLQLREVRSGQPRHFSDLLFTTNIPTRTAAENLLLKRIAATNGDA